MSGDILVTTNISWSPPTALVDCSSAQGGVEAVSLQGSTRTLRLHPYRNYTCCVSTSPLCVSFETQQRGELHYLTMYMLIYVFAVHARTLAPSSPPSITYSTTSNSITLRWGPPPEGHRNGRITQYRVQVLDIGSTILYDRNYSAHHQLGFTTAPNLTPYTIYTCRLTAFTVSEGPFVTMIIRTNESSE